MFITGSCWAEGKSYLDRFQEHMNGDGGVYIKQLLDNGTLKEDFITELVGIYPLEECLSREAELARTSLFPKGLNGNAGSYIKMTEEVREKISKAVNKRIEMELITLWMEIFQERLKRSELRMAHITSWMEIFQERMPGKII